MDTPIPEEIQGLLAEAQDYLARGLQEEPLSAGAREQRDSILRRLQRLQTRYHLEFPSRDPVLSLPRDKAPSPSRDGVGAVAEHQ